MANKATVWALEPHTRAKHVILRKYLDAWLPKITKWNSRVIICDGFAGPGSYRGGEDGSPVVALKSYLDHGYRDQMRAQIDYVFVECKKKRFDLLKSTLSQYEKLSPSSINIKCYNEDFDTAVTRVMDDVKQSGGVMPPTFAFIDPFGVKGITLETISQLMKNKKCEVFITFMMSSLQRFLDSSEFESHCTQLFGSSKWRNASPLEGNEREEFLRTLYQQQLESLDGVGASYVRFFTMKNTVGKTIYDLFFATNHEKGIDAMKDAMWKVDESGHYTFSDATDPNQRVLFESTPNWDQLFEILIEKFGGTTRWWREVEEVIRSTPFRILKRPLNEESKKENARVTIINPPSAKRNAINEKTQIRFREKDGS